MSKISKFLQSNKILVNWTIGYILFWGLVLRFVFDFNMFSKSHWLRFFNETLHGFWGLVFVTTIYGAVLIYIASAMIIYRKNKPIIEITVPDKVKNVATNISKIFSESKSEPAKESTKTETKAASATNDEYPENLPPELYVPYMRAKQNLTNSKTVSDFNKTTENTSPKEPENTSTTNDESELFPIPTDFDISDTPVSEQPQQSDDYVPTFTEINFDTPIQQHQESNEPKNGVIKYCEQNGLEYETLDEFIMMKKYLIYDHNDEGFWIMDDDVWFASGKQKKSPVRKLLDLAEENSLAPVVYFESKNILDIEHIISKFENMGIRVILELSQLS